ncbi:hypothetical protein BDR26DRAFT_858608 [Obelidium mucronatum]|nr:hypothetical protein BDR26DRAFT_858608 [Obelidium mucronatum]
MEDVLSTHLSEMEVDVGDVPAITIYRSGEESRPSRNSETSSTQSNALKTNSSLQSNTASRSSQAEEASSVTELLQAALPDKLGEFDFNYKSSHTSTTSVSMLSAKVMRFKVEKPWIPQQDDELSLNIDDIVHVYQVFNDCWCEGFVDGAEDQLGMFPRDCLSEHPLSLWDLANKSDEKITQTDSTEDPGIREVE